MSGVRTCRACGCSDDDACVRRINGRPYVCHWVQETGVDSDLCSMCKASPTAAGKCLAGTIAALNNAIVNPGELICGTCEARFTFDRAETVRDIRPELVSFQVTNLVCGGVASRTNEAPAGA